MAIQERINGELLECDDDQRLYNGTPFTGVAYLSYGSGNIKREATYKDGFEEGLCEEWFENGRLRRVWTAVHGRAKGKVTRWHENGNIMSVAEYEHGIELGYDEWSERGERVTSRRINPDSELFKALQQLRKANRPESK